MLVPRKRKGLKTSLSRFSAYLKFNSWQLFTFKNSFKVGMVAHIYNLRYLAGKGRRIAV
jgi:hypothetical protein